MLRIAVVRLSENKERRSERAYCNARYDALRGGTPGAPGALGIPGLGAPGAMGAPGAGMAAGSPLSASRQNGHLLGRIPSEGNTVLPQLEHLTGCGPPPTPLGLKHMASSSFF